MCRFTVFAVVLAAWCQRIESATPYSEPGSQQVSTLLLDFKDASRDRVVPVKLYFPKTGQGPAPVILFSHGLGGSREGGAYLGEHLASHGYIMVHMQHAGSDGPSLRGAGQPLERAKDAANWNNSVLRGQDVKFVIDELARQGKSPDFALKDRLDLDRLGMSGHSFGAATTIMVSGRTFIGLRGNEFTEPRIKASLALSPSPGNNRRNLDKQFGSIRVPVFHMTGTEDASPITPDVKPEDRRLPYDHITKADQYLLILKDGDHAVFGGRERRLLPASKHDKVHHELIRSGALAFFEAYLKGDAKAREFLQAGGYADAVGKQGVYERKTGQ
jgi:predicted dienelactone hydrolase